MLPNPLSALSRRLYLRIWLAVLVSVALLTLGAGWAWRIAVRNMAPPPTPHEITVRNTQGEVVGTGQRVRLEPGQAPRFNITLADGQTLQVELAARPPRPPATLHGDGHAALPDPSGAAPNARSGDRTPTSWAFLPPWLRPRYGFFWMLGLVGLAVALAVYPVVRKLTRRLEALQRSVQRWGDGDLSARADTQGQDEVADLARRFNAAAEHIEALLASQKSLLANASHELRSPLARIRMGLELLDAQGHPAAMAEIKRSISELDQLVGEILLASRLDARAADLGTQQTLDWAGLVAEECARAQAQLTLPQGAQPLRVHGVEKLLRRALRNLLDNASRHGQGGIEVTLDTQGGLVLLSVSDRGPGVPPEQRERIFEPFYRLPGASERDGGTGLGLALVRSIALRHNGSVRCQGREGGGATFVLSLPTQ